MFECCSSGHAGAVVASLIPSMNVVNMLLLGSGIRKDDATVKSMTRTNDHRFAYLIFLLSELLFMFHESL